VVAHTCNTNTPEAKAGGLRVRGQLGYIARHYLKKGGGGKEGGRGVGGKEKENILFTKKSLQIE
jgi:hypothetical protein